MTENDRSRTNTLRVAVPSEAPGGLGAQTSTHFGRCSHFTIADLVDGRPTEVEIVENTPHHDGGCMRPVLMLADRGIDAIVVNGIGGRPLTGFNQIGVPVYAGPGGDVGGTLAAFAAGELRPVGPDNSCPH